MSNRERLENIIAVDGQGNVLIKGEDFRWLIEQAERVELLERENKALNDMLTTLEKQDVTKLLNQNVRLIKQNKRYREALEFYADEKSWMNRKVTILMDGEPTDVEDCPAIFDDGGNIARQVLEG